LFRTAELMFHNDAENANSRIAPVRGKSPMPLVELRRDGDIAIIVIDNPPVNALKNELRAALVDALKQARGDAAVRAVVLSCAGRTFIAGADITEFGKPPRTPTTNDVVAELDAMPKPVVAAIFGTALGGGLEIALACHFRVAVTGARLGLPEIKLGIIPGAGGTQRLPRLIGMAKALPMILTGEPIGAKAALDCGLVDSIVSGDLTEGAVAFARARADEKKPLPRARDREDKLADTRADRTKFEELAAAQMKKSRGLHAPAAAIEALRGAVELPFDQGLERERAKFSELVKGDQSRAQRHIFFAERAAAKITDLPKDVKAHDIKRAAVIGAGTMGGGIAMCFANAGIPVTIVEASKDALARGLGVIDKNYRTSVTRGSLSADEMERRNGLMQGATDLAAIGGADIVIEAVFEEMDIKKKVFGDLDRLAAPSAILASNTSYLDIDAIAGVTQRPAAVLGTHFFSPANVMRLLEIVRGKATAPAVLATAVALGRKLGKVPVVVGNRHGFVGNRMLGARSIEAERLLIEGALPHEVDGALVEFGFPMGPFAMGDLAGLDVGWRNRKSQGLRAEIADALCEAGHYGQKTGKGFYRYEAGSRTPHPDDDVAQLIVAVSRRLGVTRRTIGKAEIIERLIYPMINEGARILDEKIAQRPGDIDVIWVYGYGFPVWRGGPMFYADGVGLPQIRDRLAALARHSGDKRHEPSALLQRLVAEGKGFASLEAASA
jgi:3-hydroxyacyl-CoA dehydrogenase